MKQLRSELLKIRSTRTGLVLLAAMIVLVALVVIMHVVAPETTALATREQQMRVFQVGTIVGMLFSALFGANSIAAEFRYGTIRPTFLAAPRRWPVVTAKYVSAAAVGITLGLVAEALMTGTAAVAFSARGITSLITAGDYEKLFLGGAVASALFAVVGVGIGSIIRNQTAALVTIFAWLFLVENLLRGFVPGFGRFMPGSAGLSLAGQAGERLLTTTSGALVLVGYVIVAGAAGVLATVRRDVA